MGNESHEAFAVEIGVIEVGVLVLLNSLGLGLARLYRKERRSL